MLLNSCSGSQQRDEPIPPGGSVTISVRLEAVPWDQALDLILRTNGFDSLVEGEIVRIELAEDLRSQRAARLESRRAAHDPEIVGDLCTIFFRLQRHKAHELVPLVENFLGRRGKVFADDKTNTLMVTETNVVLSSGNVQEITSATDYTPPAASRPLSGADVLDRVLDAIRRTPPGANGFTFIFTGHGYSNGILLSRDAEDGDVLITPRQFADAIIARRESFGQWTNEDTYLLLSCHSHTFLQEVGRFLQPTEAAPYLYGSTERGQEAIEMLSTELATIDFNAIIDRNRLSRLTGGILTIGGVIDLLMERAGVPAPNPTLFAPILRPGQTQRRFYQISQNPFEAGEGRVIS